VRAVGGSVRTLRRSCELVHGGDEDFPVAGADRSRGAFFPATLLHCTAPLRAEEPHAVEAFGPVSTILAYADTTQAIDLARRGRGSLCGSVFTADDREAREIVLGTAPWHGRLMLMNRYSAAESTGHGSPLPNLVHGGPGRAGGGEELGGLRAIKHYMQRTALQGSPATLTAVTREFHPGGRLVFDSVHPFRKFFDDLEIGESVQTGRRTITGEDVEKFGALSGDRFYAHFDEEAARKSLFGKRVAHGYFIVSAAAGLFVDPAPGPVLANYGLDNLRFIEPVGIGDTIEVRLTVKRKIRKEQRSAGEVPTGVVVWAAEIRNQHNRPVALYDVLTLVQRRREVA
jgi:oxepin-CoA hydrolase/3-oxo-5,6-dehydrosuberyl-CoA semialdehyde dehydrogenase